MTKKIVLLALATLCLYAKPLSLNEAISIALENNRHLKISKLAVDIAEAQYQQALSARYPQLTATVQATRMDEAPLFEMAGNVALPPQLSGALYAMTGTPMPSLPVSLDTKITGRDVMSSSLNVVYPLYTGGKIDALIKQANLNQTLQNEEARRSELEVIYDVKIDEAKSDYMPSIALLASAKRFDSDLNGGLINDATKNTWTIGVGFQWKLFEGFRTDNAVEEARLNKLTFEHKEVLLKEGLALQVKHAFIKMGQNKNQFDALERAKNASVENADLNIRAYQADMVETKDVIEAQIMDSITKLSYYRNLHDFALAQSQLEFIVAHEITQ